MSASLSPDQTAAISAALRSCSSYHQIHDEGEDEKDHDERQEGDANAADLEDVLATTSLGNVSRLALAAGPNRNIVAMPVSFNVPHQISVQFARQSFPAFIPLPSILHCNPTVGKRSLNPQCVEG